MMKLGQIQVVLCLSLAMSGCFGNNNGYQDVQDSPLITPSGKPKPKPTKSPSPKPSQTQTPPPEEETPPAFSGYRWNGAGCFDADGNPGWNELTDPQAQTSQAKLVSHLNKLSDARCLKISLQEPRELQNPQFKSGLAFDGSDFGTSVTVDRGTFAGNSMKWVNLPRSTFFKTSLKGVDLTRANLHIAELREVDLSGATLNDAKFFAGAPNKTDRALLDRVNLAGAKVAGTDFSSAQIVRSTLSSISGKLSRWTGATISDSSLIAADLSNAIMYQVVLERTSLKESKFVNSAWGGPGSWTQVDVSGASFAQASMSGQQWSNVTVSTQIGPNFTGFSASSSTLNGVLIPGSKLDGSVWSSCTITSLNVAKSTLGNSRWVTSILNSSDFSDVTAEYSDWSGSRIGEAGTVKFGGANLRAAKFIGAILDRIEFVAPPFGKTTNLERADFKGAVLKRVDFGKSALGSTILEKVNLRYANFEDADLSSRDNAWDGAALQGATYNSATKLPYGWNDAKARSRGMVKR